MDLFGDCSEEKEVVQILGKVVEARSSKSFSSFNIVAQFISEKYLLDLILPLKEVRAFDLVIIPFFLFNWFYIQLLVLY